MTRSSDDRNKKCTERRKVIKEKKGAHVATEYRPSDKATVHGCMTAKYS
jgi:hypothetical protein